MKQRPSRVIDDSEDARSEQSQPYHKQKKDYGGLYGSIASREVSDLPLSEDRDAYPQKKRKNKSVFDEYEERGGVLEGYEDLNSSQNEEKDQVLS